MPAAIACYGLFEAARPHGRARLLGVAVFSVPMNPGSSWRAMLEPGEAPCELGRFVLLDDPAAARNAETWFLARARASLDMEKRTGDAKTGTKPKHPLVIAFSDPVPRTDSENRVLFRGHYGAIYQSGPREQGGTRTGMGLYTGRGTARTLWLANDGSIVPERALSKLRSGERGDAAAYAMLTRLGAPRIASGEDTHAYVARALREGPFRRLPHGGNHRFAFTSGSRGRRAALMRALGPGLPYPRTTDPIKSTPYPPETSP
jgi:hypothetical protein